MALLVMAGVIATLAITSVRLDSATADEGAHISAGLVKLRHGWLSFFPEQPPLMNVISAMPLSQFTMPDVWRGDRERGSHWRTGHVLLYQSGNDAHRLLFLARLPTIALFLALCFAVYFVVAAEANRVWGLVAFALTGFCPTLLAHGRLATVDMAATAFGFIAFALLLRTLRKPSWISGALCGAMAMCALLSKTSGAILVPFFAFVIALHWWRTRTLQLTPLVAAIVAAIVTLYAVTFLLASPAYLATTFPDTNTLLIPWLQYKQHVDAIRFWYDRGHEHTQFLMGEFSRTGWPHYYFVAFLLKTPVATLLLLVMSIVAALRKRTLALDASLLFVALFFAVAMTSKIALGIRYILPLYPFLYTAIALALPRVVTDRRRAIVVGALVAGHCITSLIAWPSYLSFFNVPNRVADRLLIDSNLDWGQDLRRLALWAEANQVAHIRIDYFGGGDPAYELGPKRAERWPAPRPQPLPPGWFAVSRHFYRGSFDPLESPEDYDSYLDRSRARYVTTVGGSIDVYHVD